MMQPSVDTATLPDFDRMASVFDRYLPLIEPVGAAVLERMPPLAEGAAVLDVACGTGEPGLSLARRFPGLRVLGIDAAPGMIELARAKASRDGVPNVRFEVAAMEAIRAADASIDGVISRFGLLMFGDGEAAARQMARVLRPGGAFSLAVWDDPAKNTLVGAVVAALRPHVPGELLAPFDRFEGANAGMRLSAAGFTDVHTTAFEWSYGFADEEALWAFVSGPGIFGRQFAVLREGDGDKVRAAVAAAMAPHRQADGAYRIPHTCRLYWGRTSS